MEKPIVPVTAGFFFLGWILAGCGITPESPLPTETRPPVTFTDVESPSSVITSEMDPSATAYPTQSAADSGWEVLREGLDRRKITLWNAELDPVEDIAILRIDPDFFLFDVAYDPQGKDLDAWQAATGAEVVVNGGYFRREQDGFVPDGLIVVFGKAVGESYGDFAGMLAVRDTGPELRWLQTQPYDPWEPLLAGLQSFPMLIKPGGQAGFPEASEDHIPARRTVIGQDTGGRIVFLVASVGHFTLRRLSVFLESSDLSLDIAMNLDGGPSSGMLIADPRQIVPAESVLPIVITVFSK